jgi:hypothetical protein
MKSHFKERAPRHRRIAGLTALLLLLVVPLPQFAPIALTGCATPTVSPDTSPDPSPTDPSSVHLDFDWDVVRVDGVRVLSDPAVIDEFGFTPEGLCKGAIPGLKISFLEVSSPLGSAKEVIPLRFTIGYERAQSVEFTGSANVDEATGGASATYRGTVLGVNLQAFYRRGRIHITDRASITALMTYLGYDIAFHTDRTIDITTPVSLTSTPEPTRAPRYTLPKSALKYIGFGTFGSYVMAMAGHDTGESGGSDTVFFLEGGGTVVLTFSSYFGEGDWRTSVDGITVTDTSGTTSRSAGTRTQLEASDKSRFAFQKGSLILQQGGDVKVSELISAFGSPVSDDTVEGPGLHWEETQAWHRSMEFPGLEIELVQLQDATDKDVYEIASETSTDASLTTPLGWKIGMSATDVIAAAETVDWYLLPRIGAEGLLSRLDIVLPAFYGYNDSNVSITFEEDKVVSIGFNYVTVGS